VLALQFTRKQSTWVLVGALLTGLLGIEQASHLEMRTDLAELLPTDDPAVVAARATQDKVGDLNLLLFGIRSPDREANVRYADALTQRLRKLPPKVLQLATFNVDDIRNFFTKHRWLYASEDALLEARDRLRKELLKHKNPLAIDLTEDDSNFAVSDSRLDFLDQRFPKGNFVNDDYAWVLTLPDGGLLSERGGEAVLEEARAFILENPPSTYHPGMTVTPAGPVMSGIQNRQAVEKDIVVVTLVCAALIGAVVLAYFRTAIALPLMVLPATLGTIVAFAFARWSFGSLNASTAFLASIIVGNGINPAIVFLSRYQEVRSAEPQIEIQQAIATTIASIWRGTLAAALAATAVYVSLATTTFRGFSQFGQMGAVGSVACWAAAFTVLPALLTLLGNRVRPRSSRRGTALQATLALVTQRPRTILLGAVVLSGISLFGARHFLDDPFEYDFRKLSTEMDHEEGYRRADKNLDQVFGRWHSPMAALAPQLEKVEELRMRLEAQDRQRNGKQPVLGQTVTVFDILPGTPAQQERKLLLLTELRALANDPAVALLDAVNQKRLADNTPPSDLRVLLPEDLPVLARRPFTESDGTIGRIILLYHHEKNVSLWNGRDLLSFAATVSKVEMSDGTVVTNSGAPMIFGAMLRSVLRDGPRATWLSLFACVTLVWIVSRNWRATLTVAATLLLGILWMIGAAGWAQVRITFLNFVALPITFGIGIEYAVNLVSRMQQERDVARAVRGSGIAVALCSLTTIIGYGSLLAAHSLALRGFGTMAILGEVACLSACLLVLPAWTVLVRQRDSNLNQKRRETLANLS